jgi:hypothetical protein
MATEAAGDYRIHRLFALRWNAPSRRGACLPSVLPRRPHARVRVDEAVKLSACRTRFGQWF